MMNCFGIEILPKGSPVLTITKIQTPFNKPVLTNQSAGESWEGPPDFQKLWPIKPYSKQAPVLRPYHQRKVPAWCCSLASHQLLRRQILCEVRLVITLRPEPLLSVSTQSPNISQAHSRGRMNPSVPPVKAKGVSRLVFSKVPSDVWRSSLAG